VGGCIVFRTEPAPLVSTISDVVVTGNIFRDQSTEGKFTVRFETRKESLGCTYQGIAFTGNVFEGDVRLFDSTTPARTTIKEIVLADNICEGDVLSAPADRMASSQVMVRGNMLRKAGVYTLNASQWVWSGNTHPEGTLEVAAGAAGNVIHDNVTAAPITDRGTATDLNGNAMIKKALP
jgi:hypothetical protein